MIPRCMAVPFVCNAAIFEQPTSKRLDADHSAALPSQSDSDALVLPLGPASIQIKGKCSDERQSRRTGQDIARRNGPADTGSITCGADAALVRLGHLPRSATAAQHAGSDSPPWDAGDRDRRPGLPAMPGPAHAWNVADPDGCKAGVARGGRFRARGGCSCRTCNSLDDRQQNYCIKGSFKVVVLQTWVDRTLHDDESEANRSHDVDLAIDDAFSFDGARCDRIVAGAMASVAEHREISRSSF